MSNGNGEVVSVKILLNERGDPPAKLADAEVIFGAGSGSLEGHRLLGFAIWERRRNGAGHNVSFPSRSFSTNGERRTYVLLRSPEGERGTPDAIQRLILDAYERTVATRES